VSQQRSLREASKSAWWHVAGLIVAGVLVYLNSLSNPFVLDDAGNIEDNTQIRSLISMEALSAERELSTAGRPIANLSLALNFAAGGVNPFGYRVGNLALHITCALLLFLLLRVLLGRVARGSPGSAEALVKVASPGSENCAFAIALIWLVHPLNSEVVNYITQRTEALMAACYLATLYAAARSVETPGIWWQVAAVLFCTVGMGAKESMVTAPLMVVLVDRIFYFASLKETVRRRWPLYLGLAFSWLVLAVLLRANPRGASAGFNVDVSPWMYLLNQAPLIMRYLWLSVWPVPLVAIYGWPADRSAADVLLPGLLVVALIMLTLIALRKRPLIGFLGAWFFITLAVTSSVIPIATEVGAERRMYLPLAAVLTLLVVAAVAWYRRAVAPRREGRDFKVALTVVIATLSALTIARNREYRTESLLAQTSIDRYPTPFAHHVLAASLLREGRRAAAMEQLRLAVPGAPRAHYTLGLELYKDGKWREAAEQLRLFLEKQPRLVWAIDAHGYLGEALAAQGDYPAAIREFQEVLERSPNNPTAARLLADALIEVGNYELAIVCYRRALANGPPDAEMLNSLGLALGTLNRTSEAVPVFRQAVAVDPGSGPAYHNLAMALMRTGDLLEALGAAERAVELQPDNSGSRALLEEVLRLQGKRS